MFTKASRTKARQTKALTAQIKAAQARVVEYSKDGNMFAATAAMRAVASLEGRMQDVLSGNVREPFEVTRLAR